jgi:hypothetical protein
MKLPLILCAVLLSLVHAVFAAEPPNLRVRRFTVLPSIGERITETGTDKWKEFFGQLGVEWPEGSSIKFFPSMGKLVVKNTQENLLVVEELPMEQPFFHTHTLMTSVSVANGATVMIAGGMNNRTGSSASVESMVGDDRYRHRNRT